MKLKPYPKYKDSGVEWLGEIPENWGISPLKRGYQVSLGKMLQPSSKNESDVLLPYLRAANVHWSGVDTSDVKEMWISDNERESLLLKKGDLLVSEGGDVGRSAIWNAELAECYFQNSINRIRPIKDNSNKFLYYWISTVKDGGYIDILCNKSTIAHFTAEKVQALPVTFPAPKVQGSIANFLDRETVKLDTLISKQEKLIELLQEKRQAIISHAVTKGLNQDAKMKDSGVEWLGEVPYEWEVKRIKFAAPLSASKTIALNSGLPYVGMENVESGTGRFIQIDDQSKAEGMSNCFSTDDVLFGKLRPYLAKALHAQSDGICSSEFLVLRGRDVLPTFLLRYLLSSEFIKQVDSSTYGSKMPRASWEYIGNLPIPVPNQAEQTEISDFVTREFAKIENLILKAKRSIELAKEHRTALISAAVTGKIDVRAQI